MSSLTLFFCLGSLVSWGSSLEFRYYNTVELEDYLKAVNRNYSSITHLYSIGKSVEGRDLWVLILGKYPTKHKIGIPEFKYVGNMHGNEVVGRVLLLQLIEHLTQGYLSDPVVTCLLNTTRIHILPSMNPDGFEASTRNCLYSQGRFNKHGVDLNRNFPDVFTQNDMERELEVQAVMDWLKSEPFVLSANLHGGAVVASYPYDNSNGGEELQRGSSIAPDNDVFIHLAKTYSFNHKRMRNGNNCYDSQIFKDGITNGYSWYPLPGGMQDYNYVWGQCLEITLELSCCKYPPEKDLPGLWDDNKDALLAYIQLVHLGVKGQVLNSNGTPVENALVEVKDKNNLCPFKTNRNGEYYRLLLPGNYTLKVTIPGQKEAMTETLSIPYGPDKYSALTHNFVFKRNTYSSPDVTPSAEICTSKLKIQDSSHSPALAPSHLTVLLLMALCPFLL
ncbi:carboxypeptidase M [Scleropages formosus]|uniref:Carboxypeptidase M n=1 Tax=Scleropages formosus TaxID=113540 RepID=A0A8C9RYD5_SCLFO|nr:carboxypeptidase M [Scleropages formosus]XP_018611499.1 carboxypeptidase M [Scleropages formosus]